MKKTQQEPLVTVIIPSSCTEKYIVRAVESLIAQTYPNLEIIILDEGMGNKTVQSLKALHKERPFTTLRFAKNSDPFYGLNFALQKAKGKFLGIMEPEDISLPDRIEKQVRFLLGSPETIAVGGQCFLINKEGEIIGEEHYPCKSADIYHALFVYNPIVLSGSLINRQPLPCDFVFYSGASKIVADAELVFKLAQLGPLANLEDKVLFHRFKGSTLSWKNFSKTFLQISSTRVKAVKEYSYQPTWTGWLGHWIENLGARVLPGKFAYFFYRWLRVKKVKDENQQGLAEGMRNAFTGSLLPEKFPRKLLVLFLALSLFTLAKGARAEENCQTQYGQEVCPAKKLTIDKKVWNPWEEKFVDSLADITPTGDKFVIGDHVYFRIRVKNEGSEAIENIRVEDSLPGSLEFVTGDLSFNISRLGPGESEEKQIEAKAVSAPGDCKAENVAVAKFNDQEIRDTAWVCIVKERAAEIEVLPVTGVPLGFYVLASLVVGVLGLIIINLSKGDKNV
jgi:uncharacterized repeat protein (TIGR01451 family)